MNSIFKKGLLLIAAPLLFQGIFLAVLLQNERESASAESWALHTRLVIGQAESAMRHLVEESNRVRGLVITGDPLFESKAESTAESTAESKPAGAPGGEIAELRRSVRDNPIQQHRVEALGATAARLEAWIAGLEQLVRSGRGGEAGERIRGLEGERILREAQEEITGFLAEEQRIGRERLDRLAAARRDQRRLLLAAAAAAAATALFMAWLFSRGISSRLEVVTANARRLAENAPLAAPVLGRDEIAELDATLHQTAFRLAEAAAAERLFQAEIERRALALAEANEELRAKSQEIETFVYSVSHDLRSPLVNLQGFSRELERSCLDLREALDQAQLPAGARSRFATIESDMRESLRFIQTAVSRSSNIIDALLRLSRAGRVEYQWQQVDVGAVVRRVVDALRGTISAKGAKVTVGELPPAWADATAVEQIFGNLLGNAVNYLDPARPGRIAVGANLGTTANPAAYWVKDNGLGIPASYLGKLFQAFQRLHGDHAPGEGIGLALVRRIVLRHGGEIWAESQEGVGTTFFLTLPGEIPR